MEKVGGRARDTDSKRPPETVALEWKLELMVGWVMHGGRVWSNDLVGLKKSENTIFGVGGRLALTVPLKTVFNGGGTVSYISR